MQKLENVIKDLILNNKVRTQTELTERLAAMGYSTTQSNISRILKKLNTVKLVDENNSKLTYYVIQPKPLEISAWAKNLVNTIRANETNIVLRVYNGAASTIAKIIDEKNIDNVIGVLSDVNTVLVITAGKEYTGKIVERLRSMFLDR